MKETPRIIVTRTKQVEAPAGPREFNFTEGQVRLDGVSVAIRNYRQEAWEIFRSTPIPTPQEEAWRRTDLKALRPDSLRLPAPEAYLDLPAVPEVLLQPLAGESHGGQVVLMPGGAKAQLDPALTAQGVVFTDLRTAEIEHAELLERMLGKVVHPADGKFAALAGSLAQNGVVLFVPRGIVVEQPLHSLLWGPGPGLAHVSHILVWLEDGASVTYVQEYASPDEEGQALHAGIVELHVGDEANLRFVELQSWGENMWNFTHERAVVGRDANLDWIFGAIGSHVTKNFSELNLVGQGSTGRMSGFYFTDHDQHLDHDTQQNHLAAHTTSDLLFKGALTDSSRSVWQGMIYVAPGAQKADGYQANRNVVLSRKARADSIPGLEILADDVRCTHGATVGQIDRDQVFYLRARGIPEKEAERMIVEGFFDPIMQRIPFERVRERFQQAIEEKTLAYSRVK
jgi:Fe-S cluster assembly protein SufD